MTHATADTWWSGPGQRNVTLLKGSRDYTRLAVTARDVLVIEKCMVKCPRAYELEIEIVVPNLSSISLANGGWIQSVGSFAPQAHLAVAVRHGGTVDVRSMTADRVTASVEQGGRILTVPRGSLSASVTQGGVVTYWGNPQVRRSVQHGGVVHQGLPEELNVPLLTLGLQLYLLYIRYIGRSGSNASIEGFNAAGFACC